MRHLAKKAELPATKVIRRARRQLLRAEKSSPTVMNRAAAFDRIRFETSALRRGEVDRNPAFWESGPVKTTLDLPDDLMREVKIRAVYEQKKLKDAIAEFIRKGMTASEKRPAKPPKPLKLRGGFVPTVEDIEAAIAEGRD